MSRHHTRLNRTKWRTVRAQVLLRDGHRCRTCGGAGRLEAHHVTPAGECSNPYDIDNIQTRCRACHIAEHKSDNIRTLTPTQRRWQALITELTT